MRYHEIARVLTEGRDAYLFHGTGLLSAISIVRENTIHAGQHYTHHPVGVSLTRDYTLAREFGTYWERMWPVVFVFDQQRIVRSRLKIRPYRDTTDNPNEYREREAEEHVLGNIDHLDRYLVSINIDPTHVQAAIDNDDYIGWMISEYGDVPEFTFLESPETFRAAIREFASHPLINRWVPRVTYKAGTKNHGTMFEAYDDDEDEGPFVPESYVLKAGTVVYHGTNVDFDERYLDSPVWVTDHYDPAAYFSTWKESDGEPRIASYTVDRDVTLAVMDREAFDRIEEDHGATYYGIDDAADYLVTLRQLGFEGWIIPENYGYGQADILLSDANVLTYVETKAKA